MWAFLCVTLDQSTKNCEILYTMCSHRMDCGQPCFSLHYNGPTFGACTSLIYLSSQACYQGNIVHTTKVCCCAMGAWVGEKVSRHKSHDQPCASLPVWRLLSPWRHSLRQGWWRTWLLTRGGRASHRFYRSWSPLCLSLGKVWEGRQAVFC